MDSIRIKRGLKAQLPRELPLGELAFCTDTRELYVGMGEGSPLRPVTNTEITEHLAEWKAKYSEVSQQFETKYEGLEQEYATNLSNLRSQVDLKPSYKNLFEQSRVNVSTQVYSDAVVTILVDDGNKEFLNLVKPSLDSHSILGSIGVITSKVGTDGYMDLNELKNLQNEGYSILSHSHSHSADIYKGNANDADITNDFKQSFQWLCDNGFKGADTIVYPWGNFENSKKYKNLAREFYNNGVNATGGYNTELNDNMYLNREFINKNKPFEYYKTLIDQCENIGGWLILGVHSSSDEIEPTHFSKIIEYILSKNIRILPFNEANRFKGNAINIGDFEDSTKFFVSKQGKVLMNPSVLSYTVIAGEQYSVVHQSVKKEGCIICGNIKLENARQTGTFTNFQVLGTINNLQVPTPLIVSGVVTAGTSVYTCGISIENRDQTTVVLKCHGDLNLNNIRWININFNYIL